MSLEAAVVNKDRGLVEAFVAVARQRGRAGGMRTESIMLVPRANQIVGIIFVWTGTP